MNIIILTGRLAKDPTLSYTPNGAAVSQFTLAVDRPFQQNGERQADFINIVAWNKQGENCANYLSKGSKCAVQGRLQIRSYTANDGNKRWVTEVIADRVEFLDSKKSTEQTASDESEFGYEVDFATDDIPF